MPSVLSVASEAYPLIKTGGLADVAGALPAALAREGFAARTLLPGYPAVLRRLEGGEVAAELPDLFGGPARLLSGRAGELEVLAIEAPHLYGREGNPYAGPEGDWPDNAQRFAALGRVAERLARGLLPGFAPDIVHAHDWQAGLAPAYLHYGEGRCPGTVMTVHNLAFQGQFPPHLLAELGLPPEAWSIDGVEYYGAIGFLKAGLYFADRITTVSPSYAAEIRTPEGGMGLDGLLRSRGADVSGILNGIDETVWDPAADLLLAEPYDRKHLERRAANKAALQAAMGLEVDALAPLLGVVSRLTWQKGMDLVLAALPALTEGGMQLALLGAGDKTLEEGFLSATQAWPGRVGAVLGYDEALAHRIQAGCDALLVSSRFEPCGLTQLCALRYGALPLVSRVGGLADTVIDANEAALAAGVANGLQFAPTTREALELAFARLGVLWRDRATWERMQHNAMTADVGWSRPARQYAALYHEIMR